jgi:hypothetical protein
MSIKRLERLCNTRLARLVNFLCPASTAAVSPHYQHPGHALEAGGPIVGYPRHTST